MTHKPRFITLEGGEGAGKSTQIAALLAAFKKADISCITTREPGGSKGGEAIRQLVVQGDVDRWDPVSESLLFMSARYDHIKMLIKPALARGEFVLCDRFYDSTYVYQGIAKQVGTDWLDQLYSLLYGNFAPALTLYLDINPNTGLARTKQRADSLETRFENMDMTFHETLREGFLSRAKQHETRIRVIDAAQTEPLVHQAIINQVNQAFALSLPVVL
jgi:dTMP kinase